MVDTLTKSFPAKNTRRFKVRFENGLLIPDEQLNLLSGQTYWVTLQPIAEPDQPASVDALAQIAALAGPLGPADLARNFADANGFCSWRRIEPLSPLKRAEIAEICRLIG